LCSSGYRAAIIATMLRPLRCSVQVRQSGKRIECQWVGPYFGVGCLAFNCQGKNVVFFTGDFWAVQTTGCHCRLLSLLLIEHLDDFSVICAGAGIPRILEEKKDPSRTPLTAAVARQEQCPRVHAVPRKAASTLVCASLWSHPTNSTAQGSQWYVTLATSECENCWFMCCIVKPTVAHRSLEVKRWRRITIRRTTRTRRTRRTKKGRGRGIIVRRKPQEMLLLSLIV
jgi:hypothetical protein